MTHILEMFPPSKYVAAFELQGEDVTLTIKSVRAEIIEGENNRKDKRPIIYFEEGGKPLVLNKTNAKIIIKLYTANYAAWPGKRITLYPTIVDAFGDKVEAIRLRKVVPSSPARPTTAPRSDEPPKALVDRVAACRAALRSKNTIAGVENVWKAAKALRDELDPDALDALTLEYDARTTQLEEMK